MVDEDALHRNLDAVAKRIFLAALSEDRAGELLYALFDDGTATVGPDGKLVIIPGGALRDAFKR